MNQNQMNMMGNNNYPVQGQYPVRPGFQIPQEYSGLFIGFIICIVVTIVACLMPLYTMGGQSINYLYNSYTSNSDSEAMATFALFVADGICVIALGIVALVTLVKKKPMISMICQSAGFILFVNQWLKMKGLMELSKTFASDGDEVLHYGSGFYLIAISLVASIVIAWMIYRRIKYGMSFMGMNTMYQQPQMIQQPIINMEPTIEQSVDASTVEQATDKTTEN